MKLSNGTTIDRNQLISELKECGINPSSEKELVRWKHKKHGIVFDKIEDYRMHNGNRDLVENLDFVVPKLV